MASAKIKMIPAVHQSNSGFSAPAKTSATFVEGAPVKMSSGTLVACSTANKSSTTHVKKSSVQTIVGISGGKTTSGDTANILVHKLQEGMEFIGNLVHTTVSSAKVTAAAIGTTTVYIGKAKSSDTHYGWSLTAPSSSGSVVQGKITRLIDPASTVNGRVQAVITVGGALSAL